MSIDPHQHDSDPAERSTRLLSHLDGVLDATMLDAMQGAWSMLERASTDGPAHARAVRARLFWESMEPGSVAYPAALAGELVPTWDEPDDEQLDDDLGLETAEAA